MTGARPDTRGQVGGGSEKEGRGHRGGHKRERGDKKKEKEGFRNGLFDQEREK